MELSKNMLDGISIAGNASEIPDTSFNLFLNQIFDVAVSKPFTKGTENKFTSSEKTAYNCLLSLLLEAAKHDVDSTSLGLAVEDCGWESNRIPLFLKKFEETREKIQSQLAAIGRSHEHIIDAKWRQDFVIKSSNCEKIGELNYIVALKTWNPHSNSEKDVVFSCTMEQLQDLVLKLKDATKCLERNAV